MVTMLQTFKKLPELASLLLFIVVGLGFFALTNPKNLPPAVLIFGFVILLGIMYSLASLIARAAGLKERVSKGQYNGILTGATVLPVALLALQSLGQLTIRDIVTLGVLSVAAYLYISRMWNADPDRPK
jgi:hypothetical protein